MTTKIKIMIWLTMLKWFLGLLVVPISQLIIIISNIGEPDFHSEFLLRVIYMIISISCVHFIHFEIFLNEAEHTWINNEVKRLRNSK